MGAKQSSLHSRTPKKEILELPLHKAPSLVDDMPGYHTPVCHVVEEGCCSTDVESQPVDTCTQPQEDIRSPPTLEPGTYILTNVTSGTVLDLSGGDHKSIIGFPGHQGKNQQWKIIPLGGGYIVQSVANHNLYLTVDSELNAGLVAGTQLSASAYPVTWRIELLRRDPDVVRIIWQNERYVIDLDSGSATPGAKVQISASQPETSSQEWWLSRCPTDEIHASEKLETVQSVASTPVSELVIKSEDGYTITTTRTTTTVTSVTTATKTACKCGGAQSPS